MTALDPRRTYLEQSAAGMTEAHLLRDVRALAAGLGWLAYHTHDSRRSEPGFPDLVLVRDRVLYAELKTARGRVSPAQTVWLRTLQAAGQTAVVWRPLDLLDGTIARTLGGRP